MFLIYYNDSFYDSFLTHPSISASPKLQEKVKILESPVQNFQQRKKTFPKITSVKKAKDFGFGAVISSKQKNILNAKSKNGNGKRKSFTSEEDDISTNKKGRHQEDRIKHRTPVSLLPKSNIDSMLLNYNSDDEMDHGNQENNARN